MSDSEDEKEFEFCCVCKAKFPELSPEPICEPCAAKCMANFLELLLLEEATEAPRRYS